MSATASMVKTGKIISSSSAPAMSGLMVLQEVIGVALDRAMSSGSGDVGAILTSITALAAKSPFADLHDIELVKASLADPDHEWQV